MEPKIIIPNAPILIESTRSIGYSFEAALADIIDNSISANATDVKIYYSSLTPMYLAVVDNGDGMSKDELISAMRYGSKNPLLDRDAKDLGRFGLGLKTASLSQCRKVTVITKQDEEIFAACWDIDYISETNDWTLKLFDSNEAKAITGYSYLKDYENGTVVLWEKFDRLIDKAKNQQKDFDEKVKFSKEHVALVFHRYLNANSRNHINIYFNNSKVVPVDPYLTDNPATQPMPEQQIRIAGGTIKVKAYILPFASKVSNSDKKKLGKLADLRQNQGFYIYRNQRLIIWGSWFHLVKARELNKLARIQVDVPNSLDYLWDIDVKKSRASLPDVMKEPLKNIVQSSIARSEKVYKYRGRSESSDNIMHVWETIDNRGAIEFKVNRELPLFQKLEDELDDTHAKDLELLLQTIEMAFPYGSVYYHMAKEENTVKAEKLSFDEAYAMAVEHIEAYKNLNLGPVEGCILALSSSELFKDYPDVIRKIKEVYGND